MAEEFNVLHKWLGIPPDEQPPHHYRLLGVALFEPDPDVISNAADQRMAHVRTYQTGRHAKLSQQLLNQIAGAKRCLLDPTKRAEYDRTLSAQLHPPATRAAVAYPSAVEVPPGAPAGYQPPLPPGYGQVPGMPPLPGQAVPVAPVAGGAPMYQPTVITPYGAVPYAPVHSAATPVAPTAESVNSLPRRHYRASRSNDAWPILLATVLLAAAGVGVLLLVRFKPWNLDTVESPDSALPAGSTLTKPPMKSPEGVRIPVAKSAELLSPDALALLESVAQATSERHFSYFKPAGSVAGSQFEDVLLDGGLLVGFDFVLGDDGKSLRMLQPLFLTSKGIRKGPLHGKAGMRASRMACNPGFAVGGILVAVTRGPGDDAGDIVCGLQLVCLAIRKTGLDPKDKRESDWIGHKSTRLVNIHAGGKPVAGINGSAGDEGVLQLGLVAISELPAGSASNTDTKSPEDKKAAPQPEGAPAPKGDATRIAPPTRE